nr:hypothetical protein [Tanacetum cinerariifolium]
MGYEHLSITPETESDEVTESNAANLLPIPSKCEDNDDLDSSDDESLPDEDVLAEEFKIYSNPLFDEDEINSDKLDPHCFNVESDFVESLLNRDTSIDFSSKFDFSGELAHIKPEITKSDFDFEEEIRLIKNLLYDNSFPRPPKDLNAKIADTVIESIPLLPILVQDEEADLFLVSDDSIPPGIENVADDPKGDIRFLEELLIDDSILSPEKATNLIPNLGNLFSIQCSQPEDSNELFQKLLKDLKELAEYDQSTNTDRPIFLNDNHSENSSEENVVSKTNQEPPQDSDIHQLIEECSVEVPEEQKQKMEDTMLELVKICQEKEFLWIHDDIDNLIESALDSKLLSINSINSQRLDKKEQEVKIVEEQPAERRNRAKKSLQNFRVIHKNSISLNTSQIYSIHEVAPILSTKEPEHLLTMGYEHPNITPEMKSDEDNDDFDSSDDESLPDEDVPAEEFKIYSNPLFDKEEINSDKLESHCFNVEYDFVESLLNRDSFIDFSSKFDFSGEIAHINPEIPKSDFDFEEEIRLIENLVYDNSFPRPPEELNAEIADTIIESIPLLPIPVQDGNSQQEEIDIVTETDDVLPPSDEDDDDYDLLLEEVDLFLSDNSIPSGIENVADDPEGDIRFLEELLIDDSILSLESFDSSFEDNPLILRPPPEPPDDELDLEPDSGKDISAVVNKDASDDENDDYCSLMFVIRFFLPYLILPEISPLLLSAESEDTIFDH